ncbi:MAG TPA: CpsD/CapB family tyrosine-protein kinase [Pyrinomonadaceae bacterium]|nr:CpsD/CapB family tyrosine-protein kinase [Pyrinomonadaceae bacterium]
MGRVYEALKRAAENGAKGKADQPRPNGNGTNGRNGHDARRAGDPEITAERAPVGREAAATSAAGRAAHAPEQAAGVASNIFNARAGEVSSAAHGSAPTEHSASAAAGSALPGQSASRVAGATVGAAGSARAVEFPTVEISPSRVEPHLVAITQPRTAHAEQYRSLRTRLLHAGERRRVQAVVITSAGVMEGKTVTALNLAWLLAQTDGVRALLVDGDLRHPCAAEYLDIDAPVGLSEVLAGEAALEETILRLEPAGLHLLPGGRAHDNAPEMLSGPKFSAVLSELRRQFDFIIIDAPPLGIFTDATVLVGRADAALVVVRAGRTRYSTLDRVLEPLPRQSILGVVLNGAEEMPDDATSYYQRRYYRREETGKDDE